MTAYQIYQDPTDPWNYAGIVPFVPATTGRIAKAADNVLNASRKNVDDFAESSKLVAPVSGPTGLVPTGARRLGAWGEDRLEILLGGAGTKPAKAFMTSDGPRYIDRLLNGIAHESKAGVNVDLINRVWRQVCKDKDLIEKGAIEGAHWHFWQGATKRLLQTLNANGIRTNAI